MGKRGSTNLSGIVLIDKPQGLSSHDVVNRLRCLTGEGRIGHAGTLDPMATGLLVMLIGPASRLSDYLIGHDKEYSARISFGISTDTDDALGKVLEQNVADSKNLLDPSAIQHALDAFTGNQQQLPPRYSAIKKEGQKAYQAARAGKDMDLEERSICVYQAQLLGQGLAPYEDELCQQIADDFCEEVPYWDVHFKVSKGTYIRSLARDLGEHMGTKAHLAALRRLKSGSISVSEAHTLEELEQASTGNNWLDEYLIDPVKALGFPCRELSSEQLLKVNNGASILLENNGALKSGLLALTSGKKLMALYSVELRNGETAAHPKLVFPGGIGGVRLD